MNLNKSFIVEEFNKIIVYGCSNNITNLLNSSKFKVVEKMILLDIFISYRLYSVEGLNFKVDECFDEIINLNKNILNIYYLNEQFFLNVQEDIYIILNDKSLKTKFSLNFYNIDKYVYMNLIIKATYYISYDFIHDSNAVLDGMLHRNVVLNNIDTNTKVFMLLGINSDIQKNTIKLIMCLAHSALISQKKIIFRYKNVIKTNFYVKLNLISKLDYSDRLFINFTTVKLKNINNYFIGSSYLTINSFIKKSNYQITKNNINSEAIIKLSEQPIMIDYTHWDYIKNLLIDDIKNKYNITTTGDVSISDIINELLSQINDQTISLNNLKPKPTLETKKNNEITENPISTDNFNIESQDTENDLHLEEIKQIKFITKGLLKEIQQLYYILAAEKAKHLPQPIYMPYYYDFRGRIYPKSIIGFTYLKILRALFKLPEHDKNFNEEEITDSVYFNKILNLNLKLNKKFLKNKLTEPNKYFLIIHLLELGKCNKSKIINPHGLSLQNFIDNGTDIYLNKKNTHISVDEMVYIKIITDNITFFLEFGNFKNITIMRDSTASFLQHWNIILHAKQTYIKKLNLDGDTWYDTYTFIIETFLKETPLIKDNLSFEPLLKRYILKNFIMITNYNASLYRCYTNLNLILKELNINTEGIDLKLFSTEFYCFLNNKIFDIIFINDKDKILNELGTLIQTNDKSQINLTYLNFLETREDIKVYKFRWVLLRKKLLDSINKKKTQTALNANIIQASDAELARYLICKLNIQSVHDSFAINLFEIHKLVDTTNLFFNEKLKSKNYSIFILI